MKRETAQPTVTLSVIVPVYNEEENVELLYSELSQEVDRLQLKGYELIFVDDGSRDRTAERLSLLCRRDRSAVVVRFSRNFGQTAAIQAGFDLARGEFVVTMDGDLQNDPADIGRLLAWLQKGYDVACGWRRDRQDRFWTRRLPSVAANWLIGRVTGVRIHDNGCTLKAYRGEMVKATRLYSELHRFLAPMLSLSGCRYKEVVVNHRPRRFGRSKYGLSRIWKVFLDLLTVKMLLRFSSHPAPWFSLLAFPFAVGGLLSLGLSVAFYWAATISAGEFPIVMPSITVLCLFAAAQLLAIGMCAELAVRLGDFRESDPIVVRDAG